MARGELTKKLPPQDRPSGGVQCDPAGGRFLIVFASYDGAVLFLRVESTTGSSTG